MDKDLITATLNIERQLHGVQRAFHDIALYISSDESIEEPKEVKLVFDEAMERLDFAVEAFAKGLEAMTLHQKEEFLSRVILLFVQDRYAQRWKDSEEITVRMLVPLLHQELDNCQDALLEDGEPVVVN